MELSLTVLLLRVNTSLSFGTVLVLTVIQGPDKGRRYELPDHEPQLIGRSSEALPLSDNAVSRRHAELTPDDGVWYIRDLQSQNGTHVNGVRIEQPTRLRPGDQIRTGQSLFVFGTTETTDRSWASAAHHRPSAPARSRAARTARAPPCQR